MIYKYIVEIETECSDRSTFNKLDKLLGIYTGVNLPFSNNSIYFAPDIDQLKLDEDGDK